MSEYTITSELLYEPERRWMAVKNREVYGEDGTVTKKEIVLTGAMAIGCRADELLKRYSAFKEQQKQERIALAKKMLGKESDEVHAQPRETRGGIAGSRTARSTKTA